MKLPEIEIKLAGKSKPPADMVKAAKLSLGEDYSDFIAKYPGEITPAKLVKYIGERDGSRI